MKGNNNYYYNDLKIPNYVCGRRCIVWFQKISIPPPRMVNGNS